MPFAQKREKRVFAFRKQSFRPDRPKRESPETVRALTWKQKGGLPMLLLLVVLMLLMATSVTIKINFPRGK
jgi:hypothetical protein